MLAGKQQIQANLTEVVDSDTIPGNLPIDLIAWVFLVAFDDIGFAYERVENPLSKLQKSNS
jgi:hypothetical protein